MKRLLIFAVLGIFMLGSMAYATNTRVMTMGDANNIVKDEANIWLYPSTINYYPNMFIGEFWGYDGEWDGTMLYEVGAHLLFCEDSEKPMIMGFYFAQEEYEHELLDSYAEDNYMWDTDASRAINLFYGREISGMPFGFYFGYWFDSDKNEDSLPSQNMEWGLTRFEFGFGLSPMSKKLDLSLGIGLTSWTDKWYYNDALGVVDGTKPDGNMDISWRARYWMDPICVKYTLIPHAEVQLNKQGLEWYDEDGSGNWVVDGTAEMKQTMFGLGLGMNYDAATDVMVVGDMGFVVDNYKVTVDFTDQNADDWEVEDKWLILPYFKLGLDAHVFDWMDVRCGVATYWERNNYTENWMMDWPFQPGAIDRSWAEPYTDTYLGAGFHWNSLTLDAAIHPDWVGNGPYFITGDDTYQFTERVSLKYTF